jgi:hypothetical protein
VKLKAGADVIEKAGLDKNDFLDLVSEIALQDDLDGFNWEWEKLYDWADENDVWLGTMGESRRQRPVAALEDAIKKAKDVFKGKDGKALHGTKE